MLIYSVTWTYRVTPDRKRSVVGSFQDVDEIYKALITQDSLASGSTNMSGKRLQWMRVDAVGQPGAAVLSWGVLPKLKVLPDEEGEVFEMT